MHFVFFFKVDVVLGHSFQGQFFHKVHLLGVVYELVFEIQNGQWEGGRKKHKLSLRGEEFQNSFDYGLEIY